MSPVRGRQEQDGAIAEGQEDVGCSPARITRGGIGRGQRIQRTKRKGTCPAGGLVTACHGCPQFGFGVVVRSPLRRPRGKRSQSGNKPFCASWPRAGDLPQSGIHVTSHGVTVCRRPTTDRSPIVWRCVIIAKCCCWRLELGQPATRTAAVTPTIAQADDLERSLPF